MPVTKVDYQRLFEKLPARYIVLTPDLHIASVTDSYLRATKTTRAIVGQYLFDVFPDNPDDPKSSGVANVKAHFARIVATALPETMPVQKYDIPRAEADGGGFEERHWQLAGVPIVDSDGKVELILHFVDDVTELARSNAKRDEERKEAGVLEVRTKEMEAEISHRAHDLSAMNDALSDALLNRERAQAAADAERANLRDFIMQAPAISCVLRGPEHVYEIVNPAYMQMVGGRSILGKPVREALPGLAGQGLYEVLDEVYRTGKPFIGNEMPIAIDRGAGPEEGRFNFAYQATHSLDGQIDGIAVYANEVTELVAARERAKEALAAAEQSERRFRTLFDAMPQLGWTAKADGFIDFYNKGWFDYTGMTAEQMAGWGWKAVHHPSTVDRVVEEWTRSLELGVPFEQEFPLRRHDGVFRWFLTRATPIRDAEGAITRWVGVNADVDDIRAARALSAEVAAQSLDTAQQLVEIREARERSERRVGELEAELAAHLARDNAG